MSSGQWRVFVLILLLLFMEGLANPGIKQFFSTLVFNPFKQATS